VIGSIGLPEKKRRWRTAAWRNTMLARLGNVILWTTCLFASSMTASGHNLKNSG